MHGNENWKRRVGIFALYQLGVRQIDIANLYGVSRQRVEQIIKGRYGCGSLKYYRGVK